MNTAEQHEKDTGHKSKHCDTYDAYYCMPCNIWLEKGCTDQKCRFCANRPDKPLNGCGECLVAHTNKPAKCMVTHADNGYGFDCQCGCKCHKESKP